MSNKILHKNLIAGKQQLVNLNSFGMNERIRFHVLKAKDMHSAGFTDHDKTKWYYMRDLGNGISFNVTIGKTGHEGRIDVLDEEFLQPYDFQRMLEDGVQNAPQMALVVYYKVIGLMLELQMKGIINGYKPGDYI